MKRSDYLNESFKRLGKDNKITCDDCGEKDLPGHSIVNHETNKVKMVCNNCFQKNYVEWLYGKPRVH